MCSLVFVCFFFFFKQKTAYEMRISDWSSGVCSSDLPEPAGFARPTGRRALLAREPRRRMSPPATEAKQQTIFAMRYPSRHSRFGSFATNRPPDDLLNVKLVGRGGVEPPTSRLSGVRSNHLSYRPLRAWPQAPKTPKGPAPVQATSAGQLRQRAT